MVFGAKAGKATISTSAVIGSNDNGFRYSYKEIWYSQDWNGELAWELVIFWSIWWNLGGNWWYFGGFFKIISKIEILLKFFQSKIEFPQFLWEIWIKRPLSISDQFGSFWWNILLVTEGSSTIRTLKNRPGTDGTHKHCTNTVWTSRRTPYGHLDGHRSNTFLWSNFFWPDLSPSCEKTSWKYPELI